MINLDWIRRSSAPEFKAAWGSEVDQSNIAAVMAAARARYAGNTVRCEPAALTARFGSARVICFFSSVMLYLVRLVRGRGDNANRLCTHCPVVAILRACRKTRCACHRQWDLY